MFSAAENFHEIIARACGEKPVALDLIPTGWTNIVFEAQMPDGNYFFRFPRDEFWAKMMIKDCAFCDYIQGRTSFKTPDSKLLRDAERRGFSMHKKIPGRTLQNAFSDMSPEQMERAAKDIALFIKEISALSVEDAPAECKMRSSEFLRRLGDTHFADGCSPEYYARLLHAEKQHSVMAHCDLNPGNILIGEDGAANGIIDFCFAGVGGEHIDLSRIIDRSPPAFGQMLLRHAGGGADMRELESFFDTWRYIETEYIKYMKANCPEIKLPQGV